MRSATKLMWLVVCTAVAAPNQAWANPEVVRTTLQDRIHEYPLLQLNSDPARARYVLHELNNEHFKLEDKYYDAIAFKTPEKPGEFVFSFVPVEQEAYWQIVPAEGDMEGFTKVAKHRLSKSIDGVGYTGQLVIFQRIPAEQFRPNMTYVIWFSFRHTNPVSIPVSLNMFPEPGIKYEDLHPDAFIPEVPQVSAPQVIPVRDLLQKHADDFEPIEPAAATQDAQYQLLPLNRNPLNGRYGYYSARTFTVPPGGGELSCSVVPPPNLADWIVVPVEGQGPIVTSEGHIARRFTQKLPRFGDHADTAAFMRVKGLTLAPDAKLILGFRFTDTAPTDVPVSLNVLPQSGTDLRELFTDVWATTAYDMSWDLMQIAGWKLQPHVNLGERVDLYMQARDTSTWLKARNNEFEMREQRARFLALMKDDIDRYDPTSEVLFSADYEFGRYDFDKGCFPMQPSPGALSVKDGWMTLNVYRRGGGVNLARRQLTTRVAPGLDCLAMPQDIAKKFLAQRTNFKGSVDRAIYADLGVVILGLDGGDERNLKGKITSIRIYADKQKTILLQSN